MFGTSFAIKRGDKVWYGASGNLDADTQYFIASTTKLFTTAIIMKLRSDGRLDLDEKISKYIDPAIMAGLHIYKGKEYS